MSKHIITLLTTLFLTVTLTAQEQGPFCGAVGTEGCNAIAYDSSAIVGWATGCSVVRGPVDIAYPDGPQVHYGDESMALGSAGNITTVAVSLGDGGTATLTFARPIRNGAGPDFAVFENPFDDHFLELAFVEVSSDGERFVRFPATSLTQTETQVSPTGTIDPTMIHNLAGKFRVGFGTPFDLEDLSDSTGINLDSIVYVRLVDVVGTIDPQYATRDIHGNIVNDPYPTNDTQWGSGGFDLTGVAVLHERVPVGIDRIERIITHVAPNPASNHIHVCCAKGNVVAQLYTMSGQLVASWSLRQGDNRVSLAALAPGVYLLRAEGTALKVVKQ